MLCDEFEIRVAVEKGHAMANGDRRDEAVRSAWRDGLLAKVGGEVPGSRPSILGKREAMNWSKAAKEAGKAFIGPGIKGSRSSRILRLPEGRRNSTQTDASTTTIAGVRSALFQ